MVPRRASRRHAAGPRLMCAPEFGTHKAGGERSRDIGTSKHDESGATTAHHASRDDACAASPQGPRLLGRRLYVVHGAHGGQHSNAAIRHLSGPLALLARYAHSHLCRRRRWDSRGALSSWIALGPNRPSAGADWRGGSHRLGVRRFHARAERRVALRGPPFSGTGSGVVTSVPRCSPPPRRRSSK